MISVSGPAAARSWVNVSVRFCAIRVKVVLDGGGAFSGYPAPTHLQEGERVVTSDVHRDDLDVVPRVGVLVTRFEFRQRQRQLIA